jgi:acetyltransferase-like isoleucine patch superfamily enzyme
MRRFKNWKQPEFDGNGWAFTTGQNVYDVINFNWLCFHSENMKIGKDVDVGAFTLIQAAYGVELGDDVEIGPHCYICSHSTIDDKKGKVIIKKGAKIGAHSVVMPGVTIGENTIVGALSFVNKSLPPNVIAFGSPCKVKVCKKKSSQSIKQD